MDDRWRCEHYKKRLLRSASISSSNSVPQKRKIAVDSPPIEPEGQNLGYMRKFTIKRLMVSSKTTQTPIIEPQPSTSGTNGPQRIKTPHFAHNNSQIRIINPQMSTQKHNIQLPFRNQNKRQSIVPIVTFTDQQHCPVQSCASGMWQNAKPRPSTSRLLAKQQPAISFETRPSTSGIQTMGQLTQHLNSPPACQGGMKNLRRRVENVTNISAFETDIMKAANSNVESSVRPYISIVNTGPFINHSSILKKENMMFSSRMSAAIKAEPRDVLTANQYVEELAMVGQFATLSTEGRYIFEFYKFLTKVQIMSDGHPISFRLFRQLYQERKFDYLERKFVKYSLQ